MSALRAFATAGRTLSFSAAARDLHLTQGAISHQVRELESRLGIRLFHRGARGLTLTDAGRTYLTCVREALDRLRVGAEAVTSRSYATVLTVSVSPNFATKWLVPRIGRFLAAHPDVDLRISASLQHIQFANDDIDIAVRHGDGDWPHLHVVRLCPEDLFPVCSPALLPEGTAIEHPGDLRRHVLLHDRDRSRWREWLDEIGAPVDTGGGPIFGDTSLAIDAAVAGQGVALARSALAALDLKAGRLVRPLRHRVAARFAYWIVCPKSTADLPKNTRFRVWLLAEVSSDTLA